MRDLADPKEGLYDALCRRPFRARWPSYGTREGTRGARPDRTSAGPFPFPPALPPFRRPASPLTIGLTGRSAAGVGR